MEIVTAEAHADDTTVPFHPRVLRRPENTREYAYACFVFAGRRQWADNGASWATSIFAGEDGFPAARFASGEEGEDPVSNFHEGMR